MLSAARLRQAGIACTVVSVGSTPTALFIDKLDGVIMATSARAPLFSAEAVRPGAHINAVGADF